MKEKRHTVRTHNLRLNQIILNPHDIIFIVYLAEYMYVLDRMLFNSTFPRMCWIEYCSIVLFHVCVG